MQYQNKNPIIKERFQINPQLLRQRIYKEQTDDVDPIDQNLRDPEYPYTLQQLNVVSIQDIHLNQQLQQINIKYTPTIPHCSMAQMIGLMIKVKLQRSLPSTFHINVEIKQGTHTNQIQINKQINDKQRIAAAIQNSSIRRVVNKGISNSN